MNIDLYSTTFVGPSAAHLKSISGAPLGTVAFANLGLQEVQYPDQTTAIITSDPSCSPNTPTGSNVVVSIGSAIAGANQISVKFGNVTQAGFTAIAPLSPTNGTCPPAPGGFQLAGTPPICFDLSTTAIYDKTLTPAITVCVTLNGATSSLTFGHFENGTYMNRTVSVPNQPSNEICAGVQSLSPFAIFQRVPVPLTIKANPTSRQYGTGDPAFTVSYSGFVNGEDASILSGQLSCKSNSTLLSPVGSYTIDCSTSTLSSPNYIVTYAPGVLTVTPAPLTITASNRSKTYGQTVTFAGTEFTASGLVNADKMTSVTLASAGAAASASVAGSPYPITPSSAVGTGLSNYSITYNTAALTIVPASQTITLTGVPASALFGQGPFTLNASATSGLAVTLSASGNCLLSSNTLSLTGIGTCTVTASQPGNGNDNPAPTLSPSFAIGPAVTATNVSTSPATVQYSDYTTLTATISPVTVSVQALTGNVQFYLNGSTVGSSVPINSSGVATLSQLQVNLASASYPVKAVFSNTNANFAGSTGTTTQTVAQENAFILYSGDTIAQVGTTLNLRATVWDSAAAGYPGVNPETGANATIGDITKMWIAFDIYPAGSCGSGAPSTLYAQVGLTSTAGVGIAASTLSSTTEVSYCVVSRLVAGSAGGPNQFYTAPAAETAGVDFYVNSGQFATGGGWVNDPSGSHGNFGFNARYNSTGSPKGQMVYIYRALYNGVPADFIIKSNALSALQFTGTTYPISSTLQGKANVQVNRASDGYSLFSAGNYTFSATVTDSGQNGTGGKQFSLIVYDSSGAPYHSVPAGTPLQGGNVVVHSK
jgi:hypothetical protein